MCYKKIKFHLEASDAILFGGFFWFGVFGGFLVVHYLAVYREILLFLQTSLLIAWVHFSCNTTFSFYQTLYQSSLFSLEIFLFGEILFNIRPFIYIISFLWNFLNWSKIKLNTSGKQTGWMVNLKILLGSHLIPSSASN